MTQKAAAKLIGRSVKFLADSDCPRGKDRKYDRAEVAQWFVSRETAAAEALKAKKLAAEVDLLEQRRLRLELATGFASGAFIKVSEAPTFGESSVREAGELLGRKGVLTGPDVYSVITRAVDRFERTFEQLLEIKRLPESWRDK